MQTIEVPFELSLKDWLREKESNLHLRVQSPTCAGYTIPQNWTRRKGDGETRRKSKTLLSFDVPSRRVPESPLLPVPLGRGTGIRTQTLALIWR